MQNFEQVRSHVGSRYSLRINDPYLICLELALEDGRRQGVYFTELEGGDGTRFLRVSTPICPLEAIDPLRCLDFNWNQRTGYLASGELEGHAFLHLCENLPYRLLSDFELDRVVAELGALGDGLEQLLLSGADLS